MIYMCEGRINTKIPHLDPAKPISVAANVIGWGGGGWSDFLLIWSTVGQGPTAIAVGGWGCLDAHFSLLSFLSSLSLSGRWPDID